jgi:uncharacterized glyoxalase superfamily protein PhnB
MPTNPPAGSPQISGGLFYDDPEAAIDWLVKAFGFEVSALVRDPEGTMVYNELTLGSGRVSASRARAEFGQSSSPRSAGGANTQSLYVYVDDVDAHHEQAMACGAKVVAELETHFYGDRGYSALDLEGHLWSFGQRVDDAAWEAAMKS